jgi:hypothetical protein
MTYENRELRMEELETVNGCGDFDMGAALELSSKMLELGGGRTTSTVVTVPQVAQPSSTKTNVAIQRIEAALR